MLTERSDLDGYRLAQTDKPDVWLMFGGKRHRVSSPAVYDSLWSEVDGIIYSDDIPSIAMGPELNEGTCLVRAHGTVSIFLVTGFPQATRYFIPTYESLKDFGFDEAKVHHVPAIVLDAVADGGFIESAGDRRARAL